MKKARKFIPKQDYFPHLPALGQSFPNHRIGKLIVKELF